MLVAVEHVVVMVVVEKEEVMVVLGGGKRWQRGGVGDTCVKASECARRGVAGCA